MSSTINLKFIFFITFLFIILQDCAVIIGSQLLYIAPFFILISTLVVILNNYKKITSKIVNIYKCTPCKYFIWFLLFISVTTFFHNNFTEEIFILSRTILIFWFTILPSILFAVLCIPQYISYKKTLNILLYSSFFILIYGLLEFSYKLLFLKEIPFSYLFCAKKFIGAFIENSSWSNGTLRRASSIFFEPSFFATFIFLFMPLAYLLLNSKIKINRNYKADKIFKLILILLFWLCLFFTKSPIYIIFCIIYTVIFFHKNIIKLLNKNIFVSIILIISLILSCFTLNNIKLENDVYSRIFKSLESFGDLNNLINSEPSLATRVISTLTTFNASKKHIFIGTGYGNAKEVMYNEYINGELPLTYEIITIGINKDNCVPSPNIFWSSLLQFGYIATFMLYVFFFKTLYDAIKIKKYFHYKERLLLEAIIQIAINYIIISFYWTIINYPMIWFIFGILNSYILTYKLYLKKKKQIYFEVRNV